MEQTQGPGRPGHGGRSGPAAAEPRGRWTTGHSREAGSLLQPPRGGPPDHHPVCQVLRTPQGVSASQLFIELDTKSSAQAAVGLDETVVPGRVIKRTCLGASSKETQEGFLEAGLALGSAALRKRGGEQVSPRESACGARRESSSSCVRGGCPSVSHHIQDAEGNDEGRRLHLLAESPSKYLQCHPLTCRDDPRGGYGEAEISSVSHL
ncbi:uncharacterized protein LOC116580092 isoform X2 [Mustela erminea]|uniref:uncharacterized protein LOC116580092 isoform X2 n=1 Tax=Mustela erminea TaxID=36723 RepID=UPI0013869A2F|nr:uncharacterized protein LOC116580092 isoform X2 [Mustela erminea]